MRFSERRQILERDLVRYFEAIVDTRRRLNTLTDIGQLPDEILAEIYLFHAAGVTNSRHQVDFKPYESISVAHVCHRWRSITLDLPSFWSTIWLTNASCVNEVLVRSKNAPLNIRSTNGLTKIDLVEAVLAHIGRIASFNVRSYWITDKFDKSRLLATNLGTVAPRLETIVLTTPEACF